MEQLIQSEGPHPPSRGGRRLILVVERDPHVRDLEAHFLERAGFTVEFAADGEAALAVSRTLTPNEPRLSQMRKLTEVSRALTHAVSLADRFREPLDETLIHRLQNLLAVDATRFLGVPLVVGGEVIGILGVALVQAGIADDEEEWLLSALADQAAVALEKTRLDQTAEFRGRLIGIVSHDLRLGIAPAAAGVGREGRPDGATHPHQR